MTVFGMPEVHRKAAMADAVVGNLPEEMEVKAAEGEHGDPVHQESKGHRGQIGVVGRDDAVGGGRGDDRGHGGSVRSTHDDAGDIVSRLEPR